MPVQLNIDGQDVEVERGATILDAARKLGIHVPTLCHLDGLAPTASCFLCAVRVNTRANLIPACTAPAEDGMCVITDSDETREARKTALELLLSDHVGDCVAPCTLTCPARMDIPAMIRHIHGGRHREALAVIKERIPFPGVLGRICPRYCERACRRAGLDEPIAICALKRFPADVDHEQTDPYVPPRDEPTGKRVAIVGAGPAGLSAACYLLQNGHACTVFDALSQPGGMLRHAVPGFRLPQAVLDREIAVIEQLGADLQMNRRLGSDLELPQLRRDFDAVFLALGASVHDDLSCPGAELAQPALAFLQQAADNPRPEAAEYVVVGGGHEAVDAARTALRLGARLVTLLWEKARKEMPCFAEYVNTAEAEGVRLELNARALRIESHGDGGLLVSCQRGGADFTLHASCVIAAPQRRVDLDLFKKLGLTASRHGASADRHTLATNLEGVFAGGDAVSGPAAAVRAVAAGKLAAVSIHQYLATGRALGESKEVSVHMGKLDDAETHALYRDIEKSPRAVSPTLEAGQRIATFDEVEGGLPEPEARREAGRCLQCDCLARDDCKLRRYATECAVEPRKFRGERRPYERDASHADVIYESGKCVLCALCVRTAAAEGEQPGITLAGRGFPAKATVPFGLALKQGLPRVAARCAAACPTGALALKPKPKFPTD